MRPTPAALTALHFHDSLNNTHTHTHSSLTYLLTHTVKSITLGSKKRQDDDDPVLGVEVGGGFREARVECACRSLQFSLEGRTDGRTGSARDDLCFGD